MMSIEDELIAKQAKRIEILEKELISRDERICRLSSGNAFQAKIIEKFHQQITKTNEKFHQQITKTNEQAIEQMRKMISNRDEKITQLENQLKRSERDREDVILLGTMLAERDKKIAYLEARLKEHKNIALKAAYGG
jgi:uncharacterized coiled-coil protein SlyX